MTLLSRWGAALVLVAIVGCAGKKDGGHSAPPPVIRDAGGGDADARADAGPSCVAPRYITMELINSETNISIGWSGLSYDTSVPSGAVSAFEVTGCGDDCVSNCQFRGPVDLPGAAVSLRRCVNNTAVKCTSDSSCNSGKCAYFLNSHSINNLILGVQNSLLVQFKDFDDPSDPWPLTGSVDLNTGRVDFDRVNLRFYLYVGLAIPWCAGDATPYDNKKDGTCMGDTPSAGTKCDVNGVPGVGPNVVNEPTSLDCPQKNVGNGGSYFDLDLGQLSTSGEMMELSNDSPTCSLDGGKCWCGICNDETRKACQYNRDCGPGGVCGAGTGSLAKTRRDGCNFKFFTTPDTSTCGDNPGPRCGLAYNSLLQPRCHLGDGQPGAVLSVPGDGVVEDGVIRSKVSGLTCIPETTNAQINDQAGLPGVAAIQLGTRILPYTAEGELWHPN